MIEKLKLRKLDDLRAILAYAGKGSLQKSRLESMRGSTASRPPTPPRPSGSGANAHGEELWRISARVAALGDVDYGLFVDDLKAEGRARAGRLPRGGLQGVEATYTGRGPAGVQDPARADAGAVHEPHLGLRPHRRGDDDRAQEPLGRPAGDAAEPLPRRHRLRHHGLDWASWSTSAR